MWHLTRSVLMGHKDGKIGQQLPGISVLTQIWEVRKLPPQLKFQGGLPAFLQTKIRESYYDKKIHENHFYEILVLFSKPFYIVLAFTAPWAINNKEMAAFSKVQRYPLNLL